MKMINDGFLLTDIPSRLTGCSCIIVVQLKDKGVPRIGFQDSTNTKWCCKISDLIVMSISDNPEILGKKPVHLNNTQIETVKSWVKLNKDMLLQHWNDDIGSEEVFQKCINVDRVN